MQIGSICMSLWMIQSVRKEYNNMYSFAELCKMAEEEKDFPSRVDVNDNRFFAPDSMIQEVQRYCQETKQPVPRTPGEIVTVVYQSLAKSYRETVIELEKITGKTYAAINIVGGGSNAEYLNRLTAKSTGKTVYVGPTEATAIGNLTAQMIEAKEFKSVENAKLCIYNSFLVKEVQWVEN